MAYFARFPSPRQRELMRLNKKIKHLAEPSGRLYLVVLIAFTAASLLFGQYVLAAAEGAIVLLLIIS